MPIATSSRSASDPADQRQGGVRGGAEPPSDGRSLGSPCSRRDRPGGVDPWVVSTTSLAVLLGDSLSSPHHTRTRTSRMYGPRNSADHVGADARAPPSASSGVRPPAWPPPSAPPARQRRAAVARSPSMSMSTSETRYSQWYSSSSSRTPVQQRRRRARRNRPTRTRPRRWKPCCST